MGRKVRPGPVPCVQWLVPVRRITDDIALGPERVYNVPSEKKNDIQKSNEGSHKKVKKMTKKRLSDRNFDG